MKMVKSLLLGSAAGILAVAGAQAADLPVKAKPVEYVKVCSLYGAGFFYMPGTDICLKVGGYMRFQAYYGNGNNGTAGAFYGQGGFETARQGLSNDFVYRTRAVVTFDTRQQTEYGTLRTYTLLGFQHDGPGIGGNGANTSEALYGKRGFIQIAGFTFGKAQSFWDIWSSPAVSYLSPPSSDTGDPGMMLAAYTAQFGNGFTGTISLEDPRRTTVANASTASSFTGVAGGALPTGGAWPAYGYGNVKWPDVVGVLRVDQAWGSAQVMAAVHNVDADYYTGAALGSASGTTGAGHASDKTGWAVGGGAIINTDFISRGDKFQFQVNYAQGASRYIDLTPAGNGSAFFYGSGNSFGFELITDGIYGTAGSNIELTKALGINASYDHRWNERWKTSVYGYYNSYKYSDQAKAYLAGAGALCAVWGVTAGNCNPDSQQWGVGTRTQFNINASTYLGLDVMYRKIQTGFAGTATSFPTSGPRLGGVYTIEDQDAVTATFRIHRDFLP